jgi:hypothetical protein
MDYPMISIKFSKSQSPSERGRQTKTAQFEGYAEVRPMSINSEIYNIDIKTPYIKEKEATYLEAQILATNGGPFFLVNNRKNLGLFRVKPFIWTVDEKNTAQVWNEISDVFAKPSSKVKALSFRVEKAYGVQG